VIVGEGHGVGEVKEIDDSEGVMNGCSAGCKGSVLGAKSVGIVAGACPWLREFMAETINTLKVAPTSRVRSSRIRNTERFMPRIIDEEASDLTNPIACVPAFGLIPVLQYQVPVYCGRGIASVI
jgi:hypothetical protein